MTTSRHGLSLGIERSDEQFYVTLKAVGMLTHDDYSKMTPMLDASLAAVDSPSVNMLVDAVELEGWELRAAWDDLKVGLKHGNHFSKVAIVGNKRWQDLVAKVSTWFIAGEAKAFTNMAEALAWLAES
jgi:hypothetical protein